MGALAVVERLVWWRALGALARWLVAFVGAKTTMPRRARHLNRVLGAFYIELMMV